MHTTKRFSVIALLALSAAFMIAACQSRESDKAIQQKSVVKQNIQSSIDDIDNQMENLRSTLEAPDVKVPADPKAKTVNKDKQNIIKDQLADLEDYRDKFTQKLNELETVSSDDWANFQKNVSNLQNDYRQALQDYASEISEGQTGGLLDKEGTSDKSGAGKGGM